MNKRFVEEYAREPQSTVECDADGVKVTESPNKKISLLTLSFWRALLIDVFLPRGYPHSVSPDYMNYQIWDTVQAFASSMTSSLATEAVLRGAGVGDQNASALAATLTWLIRDGLGMVSRITFAWWYSAKLDADCKRWRLAADFLNDLAFSLELITPAFPHLFTPLLCLSSLARSVVAVAGGATRTTVVQHQARCNNTADVSAKDGSQETLVNVTALVCSLILLPLLSGKTLLVWIFYLLFTAIHLYANYAAVNALHFETLNQKLIHIVTREFVSKGDVCSVAEGNNEEPLLMGCSDRHYGCRISQALCFKETLSNECFTIAYDGGQNTSHIAMARGSTQSKELEAAIYTEYAIITGRFPSKKEVDSIIECLATKGWNTVTHRLAYGQWTYSEKND